MNKYELKITTTAIIIILLIGVNLLASLFTYTKIVNMVDNIRTDEEAWDEASIIVEGEEVVRGQIDYYFTNDNGETTLYFSDGNVWTTNVNNVLIKHHNTR